MKKNGILIGLSLLLLVIALLVRDWFLSFSTAQIIDEVIVFNKSWQLPNQMFPTVVFIFCFGIIPFLCALVNRTCKLFSLRKKVTSTTIITSTGLLFYVLRMIDLKVKAAQINDLLRRAEFETDADVPRMRFEDMHLELYILIGLVVGSLFSFMIYRKKSKLSKIKTEKESA